MAIIFGMWRLIRRLYEGDLNLGEGGMEEVVAGDTLDVVVVEECMQIVTTTEEGVEVEVEARAGVEVHGVMGKM